MKTTFKANIILDTKRFSGYLEDEKGKEKITWIKIGKIINSNNVSLKYINSCLCKDYFPTIIIKDKNQ